MEELKPRCNVLDDQAGLLLRQMSSLVNVLQQVASFHLLEDHVKPIVENVAEQSRLIEMIFYGIPFGHLRFQSS